MSPKPWEKKGILILFLWRRGGLRMAEKANDEIMQMLNDRSGDSRKSRNRLNRRSQLGSNRIRAGLSQIRDPGGGGQNAHICDSLEISEGQSPDFIVLCQTLPTNPLPAASSGFYCFFHTPPRCHVFAQTFPQHNNHLWPWKLWGRQSLRQQCYEITHWPPRSLRQSGPIQTWSPGVIAALHFLATSVHVPARPSKAPR